MLPHQDREHLGDRADHRRRADRLRRGARLRARRRPDPRGHRQLRATATRARVRIPKRIDGPGRRLHRRDHLPHARRPLPRTFRPLNDAIIDGRIRGVVGIVGCSNPKAKTDDAHVTLADGADQAQRAGAADRLRGHRLRQGGAADAGGGAARWPGEALREVCEAVGIPPVLHMGSCVDNSRILVAATDVVQEGGLGEDLSDLPVVGAAPEWMSEKAIAIGHYFVACGRGRRAGPSVLRRGQRERQRSSSARRWRSITGGKFALDARPGRGRREDPGASSRRSATRCGINQKAERKLLRHEGPEGAGMSKLICIVAPSTARIGWVARAEDMLARGHRGQGRGLRGRLPRHGLLPAGDLLAARRARCETLADLQPVLDECRSLLPPRAGGQASGCRTWATRSTPAWPRCSPARSSRPAST